MGDPQVRTCRGRTELNPQPIRGSASGGVKTPPTRWEVDGPMNADPHREGGGHLAVGRAGSQQSVVSWRSKVVDVSLEAAR